LGRTKKSKKIWCNTTGGQFAETVPLLLEGEKSGPGRPLFTLAPLVPCSCQKLSMFMLSHLLSSFFYHTAQAITSFVKYIPEFNIRLKIIPHRFYKCPLFFIFSWLGT